ncbi:D-amino-acid oxidase [Colletotrichum fructicola]|uniref:D-amino-acid oxidase n=1 Tax=Colletotrichum fructicola (strain Nara gc5) TaxID=1213859 RepID=L2FWQ2_COLFN|nr:D-amino-acid oxidase [Colletotrichum fructicola]KAE9570800.1 D-amino-acid oxidase [Colletotrichum fructicola]KAF4412900.1 D-amino-acid oxidase [Colletotrichum fructicola]KAF4481321.1 D-amino-acid oxidase [Colletotrichum fructicola Nara gc5]KAF4896579.1 D-amino-acid oxidase [Colletotrichum fructicola]
MAATTNIVVLGAGVSGLTTALLLSKNKANSVTIVAKHMPGDYDIEYASPWAGATFQPMSEEEDSRWERRTWPELSRLASSVPEAGIHFQRTHIYRRNKDFEGEDVPFGPLFSPNSWLRNLFSDYRDLKYEELPNGVDSGFEYTGVCINTSLYLPWLVGQCRAQNVVLKRGAVSHIDDLKTMHHSGKPADVLVNASGLQARDLGGVMDRSLVPIRGQIVLVQNEAGPLYNISGTDDGDAEISHLMMRASGGGTVLGGTYDKGNWSPEPDMNIAKRIIKRCVALSPQLANGKGVEGVEIIRHGVGLRPWRKGGVRLETDFNLSTKETLVVHNYGHAGWGYQGSYGCAEYVVELVEGFQKDRNVVDKAKL